jgi:cyanate permease
MAAGAYFTGLFFDLTGSYYLVFVIATGIAAFAMINMPRIKETSVSERS